MQNVCLRLQCLSIEIDLISPVCGGRNFRFVKKVGVGLTSPQNNAQRDGKKQNILITWIWHCLLNNFRLMAETTYPWLLASSPFSRNLRITHIYQNYKALKIFMHILVVYSYWCTVFCGVQFYLTGKLGHLTAFLLVYIFFLHRCTV